MTDRPNSPCVRECSGRSIEPNCHSTCEKYLAFKEDLKRYKEEIFRQKHTDIEMDQLEKTRARRRRKK